MRSALSVSLKDLVFPSWVDRIYQEGKMKFATMNELMERYNISRRKAQEIADAVGTAPRRKGQKVYVPLKKADEYMEGRYEVEL